VQNGIKKYDEDVRHILTSDRYLKINCVPFMAANLAGRMPYFLYHKIITKSDIYSKKNEVEEKRNKLTDLMDDEDAEEERRMIEFNNNFSKNKVCYDPSLLVGVVVPEEPCSFSPPLVTQLIKRNQITYQGELDEHELDEQEEIEDDDNNDDDDSIFPLD
jgi:hypothetical protein